MFWPVMACAAVTAVMFMLPNAFGLYAGWNNGAVLVHHPKRVALAAALSLAMLGMQWWTTRRPRHPTASPMAAGRSRAAAAVLLALLATQTPPALSAATLIRQQGVADAAEVHRVIGDDPVVYLTPGWSTYFLGNPTQCPYPSPLFLQRPLAATVVAPAHRQVSMDCLAWPGARWLVWRKDWLTERSAASDVLTAIARSWDCVGARVVAGYTLCPRRR